MNNPVTFGLNLERLAESLLRISARLRDDALHLERFDFSFDSLTFIDEERLLGPLLESGNLNVRLESAVGDVEAGSDMQGVSDADRRDRRAASPPEEGTKTTVLDGGLVDGSRTPEAPRFSTVRRELPDPPASEFSFEPAVSASDAQERWQRRTKDHPLISRAWNEPVVLQGSGGAVVPEISLRDTRDDRPSSMTTHLDRVLRTLEWEGGAAAPSPGTRFTSVNSLSERGQSGRRRFESRSVGDKVPATPWPGPSTATSANEGSELDDAGFARRSHPAPNQHEGLQHAFAEQTPQAGSYGLRRLWELGRPTAASFSPLSLSSSPSSPGSVAYSLPSQSLGTVSKDKGGRLELQGQGLTEDDIRDAIERILRREAERDGIDLEGFGL